ncbi:hypothetical protein CALCODRAFT_511961 [Calocera cornea HHB12733]|uniref:Nucleic acid-binding protein n=1 Tax=Calocera cornea HHB12733 TaxID=1353952 RepID=A0A165DE29_9BASI|nr:hypothetical protein CALCODRAFT_511961 [Calocera cornea HHB12733]
MSHLALTEHGCLGLVNQHTADDIVILQLLWCLWARRSNGQLLYPTEYTCFLSDGTNYVQARLDPRAQCMSGETLPNGVKVKVLSLSKRVSPESQTVVLTIHELEVVSPSVPVIGHPVPLREVDEPPVNYRPVYPSLDIVPLDNTPRYIEAHPRFDYTTIARLSPSSEQFCIIARITKISTRGTCFNKSLRVKLDAVEMNLHDETGEMKALAWEEAADKVERLVLKGVYLLWGATVFDATTNNSGLAKPSLRLDCDGRTMFKRVRLCFR